MFVMAFPDPEIGLEGSNLMNGLMYWQTEVWADRQNVAELWNAGPGWRKWVPESMSVGPLCSPGPTVLGISSAGVIKCISLGG